MLTKTCTLCLKEKPLEQFGKSGTLVSGEIKYQSKCKCCLNEEARRLRKQDPERFRRATSKAHQSHREERLAKQRAWRESNKEKEQARVRTWAKENRAKRKKAALESVHRAVSDKTVTSELIEQLYNQSNCTYCAELTESSQRVIDHIQPLSKGGQHSSINLAMCCRRCNNKKKDLPLHEFIQRLALEKRQSSTNPG